MIPRDLQFRIREPDLAWGGYSKWLLKAVFNQEV